MREIPEIVAVVVQQLVAGGLVSLLFLSAEEIGRGFFRSCSLTFAALQGIVFLLNRSPGTGVLLGLLVLYAAFQWGNLLTARRLLLWGAAGGGLLAAVGDLHGSEAAWGSVDGIFSILNIVSSMLILGSVVVGMLLGHYYLVQPHLSVRWIRRIAGLFLSSTITQGLVPALALSLLSLWGTPAEAARLHLLASGYPFALLGRVLVGVVGSFIVAYVIWDTLRVPNVQSATGFFYIALLTVLIGEFLGRYLMRFTSLPL